MIIGKGLLARAFEPHFGKDPEIIIFASGVSNSLETRSSEFAREHSLLRQLQAGEAKRLVYFGSCGVAAEEVELTPYMKHKKLMESLVLSSPGGLVLRLPQVVGAMGNPNTLSNFIHSRILSGEHFTVWAHAERNLIDIDDLVSIGTILITEMDDHGVPVVSIAAKESMPMTEIVKIFERVHGKSANYSIVEKGDPLKIDTRKAAEIGTHLGIDLGDGYIERVLRKYYAHQ